MIDLRFDPPVRRRLRLALRAVLLALALTSAAAPARAWDASTPPRFFPSPYDSEFFHGVAVQPDGGVIVAGTLSHPNVGRYDRHCIALVARIARRTGAVDWRTELPDCGDDETYTFNPDGSSGQEIVRIDPAGDVVVARFLEAGRAAQVVKLDGGSGEVRWQVIVARPTERTRTTLALALDAAGDVLVAGGDGGDYPTTLELFVAKLDGATGAERWRHELRGTSTDEDYARNQADAIAVDARGDVVVHGRLVDDPDGDEQLYTAVPLLMKLAGADGRELWRAADGVASTADVAFDAAGDVLVAGPGEVAKVAGSDGATRWRTRIGDRDPAFFELPATRVAVAGDDVAVAGDAGDAFGENLVRITTLDAASGVVRWQAAVGTPEVDVPHTDDRLGGIGFDAARNVVVAARVVDPGGFARPLVASFHRASGTKRWERTLDGSERTYAGAYGLAVDGDAAIAVGGVARDGAFTDGFVQALATASGVELWLEDRSARQPTDRRGVWLDEIALDAAVDGRGNVVAVGRTWHGVESRLFTVRKLDGETGSTRWTSEEERNVYAFPGGLFEYPVAERVAIDPAGDVVALTGEFSGTVVKLAGDRGSDLWSTDLSPTPPTYELLSRPLAIDAAGDVLVGASGRRTIDGSNESAMVVVKLDGRSGQVAWDAGFAARSAFSIALDATGDVVAAARASGNFSEALLVKYDGETGAELWRHQSALRHPGDLAVREDGDVLLSARLGADGNLSGSAVVAIDGATGAELWQSASLAASTLRLTSDAAGDVFATSNEQTYLGDDPPPLLLAVATKLDGATGATIWQRSLADLGTNVQLQDAVLDADGTLVLAAREVPGRAWLVGLDGDDGAVLWTIGLGDDGTTFDVRALRVAGPGRMIVAGARSEADGGTGFAVLGIDLPSLLGPKPASGRRCIARLAHAVRSGRPAADRCTVERGRLAAHRR